MNCGLSWSSDDNTQPSFACYVLTLIYWVAPRPAKPSHLLNPKMSANNTVGGIPATIIFTLIISFFAFFAAVTCVTLYYYKRDPRRLQRLRQIEEAEARDSITFGAWEEAPAIWEVWADKHPKPTSEWEGLLVRLPFTCSLPFLPSDSAAASEFDVFSRSTPAPRVTTSPKPSSAVRTGWEWGMDRSQWGH